VRGGQEAIGSHEHRAAAARREPGDRLRGDRLAPGDGAGRAGTHQQGDARSRIQRISAGFRSVRAPWCQPVKAGCAYRYLRPVRVPYFAYGTTQAGFTHHRRLGLGAPVGRYRTVAPHAVVVPHRPACNNPGCEYVHRMAALVPGLDLRVEGDLFVIGEDAAAAIEALEVGAYVRNELEVAPVGGGPSVLARAYLAREPARWIALVERGEADALTGYPVELATTETRKDCCLRAPGHAPPHDVLEVLP
jgi:hypothetical protein